MIYLHIGRARTGSSTVQRFLVTNTAALARNGVVTPDIYFAHRVARGMRAPDLGPDSPVLKDVRALVTSLTPGQNLILSSEAFLRESAPAKLLLLRRCFEGHDVKIIIYLRSFTAWLPSLYNQHTAMGRNALDFDAFFDRRQGLVVAKGTHLLRAWMDVFGASSVRVRSMPLGDALVEDFATAVDAIAMPEIDLLRGKIVNSSKSWMAVELARFLANHINVPKTVGERGEFAASARYLSRAIRPENSGKAQYLTPEQWSTLSKSYRLFVDSLNAALKEEAVVVDEQSPPPSRLFLPSVQTLPSDVRERLAAIASHKGVRARHPDIPPAAWQDLSRLGA